MTRIHPDYSDRTRVRLTKLARELFKDEGFGAIAHIHPRAYCVGKLALNRHAIFVFPQCDGVLPETAATEVWGAERVKVGEWYAIAYVNTGRGGFSRLIEGPL